MFSSNRDTAKNPNLRWRPPPSWILVKVGFLVNPCIVNVYVWTKFDANIFINDMAKNPNPKWRPPPSCIFPKVAFWVSYPVMSLTICTPNLRQLSPLVIKIWQKSKMAATAILNFGKIGFLVTLILVWSMSICIPNLMQISLLTTRIWPKIKSYMVAATILNIIKSVNSGINYTRMVNVNLHTKL